MAAGSKVDIWNKALAKIGETVRIEDENSAYLAAEQCRLFYDDLLREVLESRRWPWAIRQRPLVAITTGTDTYAGDDATTQFEITAEINDVSQLTVEIDDVEQDADDGDFTFYEAANGANAYVVLGSALASGSTLELTVATSREGWDYAYTLPSDCVTPIALLQDNLPNRRTDGYARTEFAIMASNNVSTRILVTNVATADFASLEYVAMITEVPLMPAEFIDALSWRLAEELAYALPKDMKKGEYCRSRYRSVLQAAFARDANLTHIHNPETPGIAVRQ